MRYFLSNATNPLKYFSCGNLISKADFLHHRRCFDVDLLIMVREGILYISVSGVKYEVGPNQYIFIRANEEHYGYKASEGKLSYIWAHFSLNENVSIEKDDSFTNEFFGNSTENPKNNIYILPEHGEISLTQRAPLLFNQLLDLSRQEFIYTSQIIDYALSLLVMEVSQEFIEMNNKLKNNIPPNIAKVMEWIKANYYKPIIIGDIAKEFGYNSDYLSALFRKTTGNTLVNYINKTRIDISKSLIANYDISIKEAAYSCGFSDEKYFMKTFKRFEGITPSQYKKAFTRKMIN